jgi:hypothetical protein
MNRCLAAAILASAVGTGGCAPAGEGAVRGADGQDSPLVGSAAGRNAGGGGSTNPGGQAPELGRPGTGGKGGGGGQGGGGGTNPGALELSWDFEAGAAGWVAGFSDYPAADAAIYDLSSGVEPLPAPLDGTQHGLGISGDNHSDDLWMYVARRLSPADGLSPNTTYAVSFSFDFATRAPTGCFGVGGAPAESVFLKVGASPQPAAVSVVDGDYEFSLAKGNQSVAGAEATLAGHIGSGHPCPSTTWALVSRQVLHQHLVTSDAAGELTIYLGTDSGFEARSHIIFDRIAVTLTPQ